MTKHVFFWFATTCGRSDILPKNTEWITWEAALKIDIIAMIAMIAMIACQVSVNYKIAFNEATISLNTILTLIID